MFGFFAWFEIKVNDCIDKKYFFILIK